MSPFPQKPSPRSRLRGSSRGLPSTAQRSMPSGLVLFGIAIGLVAALGAGGWLAVQLILHPESVGWLNHLLPLQNRYSPDHPPQALAEIQAELAQQDQLMGTTLTVREQPGSAPNSELSDLLLPVYARRPHCLTPDTGPADLPFPRECGQITELRVYRPIANTPLAGRFSTRSNDPRLVMIDQVSVSGPDESFVAAPFIQMGLDLRGSARSLPLETLQLISGEPAPTPGVWLHLSGTWSKGGNRATYGQVVYYSPDRGRLDFFSQWTSPANELPEWDDVTATSPALVVNQTIGLEPQFELYQVVPASSGRPMQLREITLMRAAIADAGYEQGLILARSGLWTPALERLKAVEQRSETWPGDAQAQMDAIALHARLSQAQANREWASPGQKLMANLIDGRWNQALQIFETAVAQQRDLSSVLEDRSGRLWDRVEAALQVNPNQPDVHAWGVLMLTVQQNRGTAIAWLRQQTQTAQINGRLQQVLDQLDASPEPVMPPITTSSRSSQLIGTAIPLATVNASDWSTPDSRWTSQLGDQQSWYEIQVDQFFDGQAWQRSLPDAILAQASDAGSQPWQVLGLTPSSQLRLMVETADGRSQTLGVTVQAMRVEAGALHLLAIGSALTGDYATHSSPRPLLAFTADTVQVTPRMPQSTLRDFTLQEPDWAASALPHLQALSREVPSLNTSKTDDILTVLGSAPIQRIDLTGDQQAEVIIELQLALTSEPAPTVNASLTPQNWIVSDAGDLLYSGQLLWAIATFQNGNPAIILQDSDRAYHIRRWSPQSQQFE